MKQVQQLNLSVTRIKEASTNQAKQLEGFENIVSIKGVGKKSATILLSVIGDVNEFENESKLAAYLVWSLGYQTLMKRNEAWFQDRQNYLSEVCLNCNKVYQISATVL